MMIMEGHAREVVCVVSKGLGTGFTSYPVIGEMCVEVAICHALGLPHSDHPVCVGDDVRQFSLTINDSPWWYGADDRAKGLKRFAVAQLGSDAIDQNEFCDLLYVGGIKAMLPIVIRYQMADAHHASAVKALCRRIARLNKHQDAQELMQAMGQSTHLPHAVAAFCWRLGGFSTVRSASASNVCMDAIERFVEETEATAVHVVRQLLELLANAAVNVLIKMKSPGTRFLYLCDPKPN